MGFKKGRRTRLSRRDLLGLLVGGPAASDIGSGTLAGSSGETLTLTRATAKTCLTSATTMVSLTNNQPAVEAAGLLVEAASDNLCVYAKDFTAARWGTQGIGAASGPSVTANAALAPDGTTTANLASYPAVSVAASGSIVRGGGNEVPGTYTTVNGDPYTISCWIRGVSGSGTLYLMVYDTSWRTLAVNYTTTWQRFSFQRTVSATSMDLLIGVDLRDGGQTAKPAQDVYLWGAQIEAGSWATSNILTTGSIGTRNADVASMSSANLPVASGTVELNYTPQSTNTSGTKVLVDTRNGGGLAGLALYLSAANLTWVSAGGAAVASAGLTWTAGTTYALKAVWGSGNVQLYRDGVLVASDLTGTYAMPSAHTALYLGRAFGGASQASGHISNMRWYY